MNQLHDHLRASYQNKRILILGFGREGQSTYKVLRAIFPEQQLAIADEKPLDLAEYQDSFLVYEPGYLNNLMAYDVIFKAPGISIWEDSVQEFLNSDKVLTSQLNEFLAVYKLQTIGVTGTKGKSTTSSLIYHILQQNGRDAILAGNIGIPVFSIVEQISSESVVVIEMSSYQLEISQHSPHVAVFLNLFAEHLNYHRTFEQYAEAKAQITRFQSAEDFLIYNAEDAEVQKIAQVSSAQKNGFAADEQNFLQSIDALKHLPAVVKKQNVLPAVLAAEAYGVSREAAVKSLESFQPLPHRLQLVAERHGVQFIDDTLATIPEATCEAIDAVERVDVILLGGFDRGIDYKKVVDKVVEKKIPVVVFFKPSGERMHQILTEKYTSEDQPKVFFPETMKEAVRIAVDHAQPGGTVLLSPSSPSYGQFKDYEDKAAQFVQCIQDLAHET